MAKLLSTHVSNQIVRFKPGGETEELKVSVQNHSPTFATFHLELTASGVESGEDWYRLAPEISARIPSGDRTQFSVTILDVPPVPGGFIGTMTLTIRVYSLELKEEDRQIINLIIEGTGTQPTQIQLSEASLEGKPGDTLQISARLFNLNRHANRVHLRLSGLPPGWLLEGQERRLQLPAQKESVVTFPCRLPTILEDSLSQVYPFMLEASQAQTLSVRVTGTLTVLPVGLIELQVSPDTQTFPSKGDDPESDQEAAIYGVTLSNQSNLFQTVSLLVERRQEARWFQRLIRRDRSVTLQPLPPNQVVIQPSQLKLEVSATEQSQVLLTQERPWLGWARRHQLQVTPQLSDPRISVEPPRKILKLRVLPRIPFWLQLLVLFVPAGILLLHVLLRAQHQGPVNAVQFDGVANEVVSASDDHRIRRWRVSGRQLLSMDTLEDRDRAVRVIRYRPVDNNVVAAGLENGQIQIWNLLSERVQANLPNPLDDRVFDLQFTQDSQFLFSGHGSGQVLQWNLATPTGAETEGEVERQRQVDFAVQALALVGQREQYLAIAGRFNRLVLWDWQADRLLNVDYPAGSQTDYILDLAVADRRPERLVTADNQGQIRTWDLRTCLAGQDPCAVLDEQEGHQGKAVQAIALSADGCYLASGGEDGRLMLWFLDSRGQIANGKRLGQFGQPVNAVDILRLRNTILVISGGDDHRVRLYRVRDKQPLCG